MDYKDPDSRWEREFAIASYIQIPSIHKNPTKSEWSQLLLCVVSEPSFQLGAVWGKKNGPTRNPEMGNAKEDVAVFVYRSATNVSGFARDITNTKNKLFLFGHPLRKW